MKQTTYKSQEGPGEGVETGYNHLPGWRTLVAESKSIPSMRIDSGMTAGPGMSPLPMWSDWEARLYWCEQRAMVSEQAKARTMAHANYEITCSVLLTTAAALWLLNVNNSPQMGEF